MRAYWNYHSGRRPVGNVGQASRLPSRAGRRGVRTTKASLRSAGQARRLPYIGATGHKMIGAKETRYYTFELTSDGKVASYQSSEQ